MKAGVGSGDCGSATKSQLYRYGAAGVPQHGDSDHRDANALWGGKRRRIALDASVTVTGTSRFETGRWDAHLGWRCVSFRMMGRHGSHGWGGRRGSVTSEQVHRVCSGMAPCGVGLARGATDGGGGGAGAGGRQQLLAQESEPLGCMPVVGAVVEERLVGGGRGVGAGEKPRAGGCRLPG